MELRKWLRRWIKPVGQMGSMRRRLTSTKLRLEVLEDRVVPATNMSNGVWYMANDGSYAVNYGGPVISSSVTVDLIFWGSGWQQGNNPSLANEMKTAVQNIGQGSYLSPLSQYSGAASTGSVDTAMGNTGIAGEWFINPGNGYSNPNSAGFHQGDVNNQLQKMFTDPNMHIRPQPNHFYFVIAQPGSTFIDGQTGSTADGWHGYDYLKNATTPTPFYFGLEANGTPPIGYSQLDVMTNWFSHELVEAITDPQGSLPGNHQPGVVAHPGWVKSDGTDEIADQSGQNYSYREPGPDSQFEYLVQSFWSNDSGFAGSTIPGAYIVKTSNYSYNGYHYYFLAGLTTFLGRGAGEHLDARGLYLFPAWVTPAANPVVQVNTVENSLPDSSNLDLQVVDNEGFQVGGIPVVAMAQFDPTAFFTVTGLNNGNGDPNLSLVQISGDSLYNDTVQINGTLPGTPVLVDFYEPAGKTDYVGIGPANNSLAGIQYDPAAVLSGLTGNWAPVTVFNHGSGTTGNVTINLWDQSNQYQTIYDAWSDMLGLQYGGLVGTGPNPNSSNNWDDGTLPYLITPIVNFPNDPNQHFRVNLHLYSFTVGSPPPDSYYLYFPSSDPNYFAFWLYQAVSGTSANSSAVSGGGSGSIARAAAVSGGGSSSTAGDSSATGRGNTTPSSGSSSDPDGDWLKIWGAWDRPNLPSVDSPLWAAYGFGTRSMKWWNLSDLPGVITSTEQDEGSSL